MQTLLFVSVTHESKSHRRLIILLARRQSSRKAASKRQTSVRFLPCITIFLNTCICLYVSLSLSLSLYIYIYIYILPFLSAQLAFLRSTHILSLSKSRLSSMPVCCPSQRTFAQAYTRANCQACQFVVLFAAYIMTLRKSKLSSIPICFLVVVSMPVCFANN